MMFFLSSTSFGFLNGDFTLSAEKLTIYNYYMTVSYLQQDCSISRFSCEISFPGYPHVVQHSPVFGPVSAAFPAPAFIYSHCVVSVVKVVVI